MKSFVGTYKVFGSREFVASVEVFLFLQKIWLKGYLSSWT